MSNIKSDVLAALEQGQMACFQISEKLPQYAPKSIQIAVFYLKVEGRIRVVDTVRRSKCSRLFHVYAVSPKKPKLEAPAWLYPHVKPFSDRQLIGAREVSYM